MCTAEAGPGRGGWQWQFLPAGRLWADRTLQPRRPSESLCSDHEPAPYLGGPFSSTVFPSGSFTYMLGPVPSAP